MIPFFLFNPQVVIFSKTYCGFCTSVKGIFSKPEFAGVSVVIHELDSMPNGTAIQQALASMTGQRTVPNVFVKGNHVGGNDDVQQAYRSGNLLSMLELK
jgi:glutaredoxin 3